MVRFSCRTFKTTSALLSVKPFSNQRSAHRSGLPSWKSVSLSLLQLKVRPCRPISNRKQHFNMSNRLTNHSALVDDGSSTGSKSRQPLHHTQWSALSAAFMSEVVCNNLFYPQKPFRSKPHRPSRVGRCFTENRARKVHFLHHPRVTINNHRRRRRLLHFFFRCSSLDGSSQKRRSLATYRCPGQTHEVSQGGHEKTELFNFPV